MLKQSRKQKGKITMSKEKKKKIDVKRITSGIAVFVILLLVLVFANSLIMNIFVMILSIIGLYEYCNCFKNSNKAKPNYIYMIIVSLILGFIQILYNKNLASKIDRNDLFIMIIMIIPISIIVLICEMIFNNKRNIIDICTTIFGIVYIPLELLFFSMTREDFNLGRFLVWYIIIAAWGSDSCAYLIGKNFGKHHFTKLSPNKTIEGCVAGIIGAMLISIVYTISINQIFNLEINILTATLITGVLALIGQIGDLTASSVKRYCEIKDFSELIPGHGGLLDRIDSVILVSPFAYILMYLFI